MKKKLFYLYLLSLLLSSCTPILKTIYGVKNPKIESQESLQKYMNSIDMNSENILLVKNKDVYKTVLKEFQKSIPEAVLFDASGNRITYKNETKDCNAGLFSTIPNLRLNDSLKKEEGSNLKEFSENLIDFKKNKIEDFPEADFYLFIDWAKFMGKLN
ncbi:hypothetical protein [Epilithonimonas sp.]|uniref:hypothetical protein n=1 Tax=Epilithonimonas sp. TaxID=2894511 RepID=UPI002897C2DF|nr:hypothetical protein [Epilithonimonas sp.]